MSMQKKQGRHPFYEFFRSSQIFPRFYVYDRTEWAEGPWMSEPDNVFFESHGFFCRIQRAGAGHWCGYVKVPEYHPWYSVSSTTEVRAEVHGGVTWASHGSVGFDCAHSMDLTGFTSRVYSPSHYQTYRTMAFAFRECEKLARQASLAPVWTMPAC